MAMQSSTSKILTLFKQSFAYSAGNLLNKLLLFLMIPLYANFIAPENLSLFEILDPAEQFIFGITNLGIIQAFYRYYTKDELAYTRTDIVSTILWLLMGISIIMFSLLFIFRDTLSEVLLPANSFALYCYLLTVVSLFIRYYYALGAGSLHITLKAQTFAMWKLAGTLLFVVYGYLFIALWGGGITRVFEGRLLMLAPVAIAGLWGLRSYISFTFKPKLLKRLLKFSYPFILSLAAYPILTYIDRWMLSELAGSAKTGIYGISYRFGMIPGMLLVQPFLKAWRPFIYNYDDQDTQEVAYKRILLYYTLVGAILWLGISTFSEELVKLITSRSYYSGHVIIPYIASSQLFYGLGWIVIAGLAVKERTFFIGFCTFMAALLNIVLNYYWIPEYGMLGAAYSTLAAFFFIFAGYSLYSFKKLPLKWPFLKLLIIISTVILAYYLISLITIESIWIQLIVKAVSMIPVLLFLARVAGLNLFKLNEIKNLFDHDGS